LNPARHVMIRASAGSGKTYALTNRFVALLAHGAPPQRIVALTFTRKAAGEFFDEILNKLARAASKPANAKKLAAEIGLPDWTPADFLRLLRMVVDAMPALRLGTLDGFFARIARSFPLELGLTGQFELLEEHSVRRERARVLRQMFAHRGELDDAQKEFAEAFKRATFGRDEKRLGAQLDAFLDDFQEKYLSAPEALLWGNEKKIWPEGNRWLGAKTDARAGISVLRHWLEESGQAEKQRVRWLDFFEAVETWRPGAPVPRALAFVLEKALTAWDDLVGGSAVLSFDKKMQNVSGPACAALVEIVTHVIGGELLRRLETTRGIHAVLRSYESTYDDEVRRAGKLTFADVQRLLMPGRAPVLTGEAMAGSGRLFIDYRLDAEIDHWLLDEFQDTSVGQWSVLRNLVDEAVQDPSGERSFFCVGDVKQAIFTWREGDPRLFQDILDHYNEMAPGTISEEKLVDSWRSGPALIEMVNAVFGDRAAMAELFSKKVADAWNREWNDHRSAVPERTGQAALLFADDEAMRRQRLLELLREIGPLQRGLTCAVLVRKNSVATEIADLLRNAGIPALAESDLHVCTDNPVGTAMLAMMQAAAHPGDTLAWEHLQMTPLGSAMRDRGMESPSQLAETVLGQIHAAGFERTIESWWRTVEGGLDGEDNFSRLRARQLMEAARIFDESSSRDVADFIAFMERYTVRDAESSSVVRVMTIHKSKGLGFDVVLLPDLEGNKLAQRRQGLAVQKQRDGSVDWVLDLPNDLFRAGDPVLSDHVAEAENEAGYEALSLLYVALTRAKRAMYAIIEPVGDSKSINYPKVLTETLGADAASVQVGAMNLSGSWSAGDPEWHRSLKPAVVEKKTSPEIVVLDRAVARPAIRHPARRPSDRAQATISLENLFVQGQGRAANFGAQVHELFAEVEWLGAGDVARWEAKWRSEEASGEAIDAAVACLRSAELAPVWHRMETPCRVEVWREKAFEVVLDGVWLTGVFDRVVVEYDMDNRATAIWVIDFKTDRIPDSGPAGLIARHSTQLDLYRRVAALLTGLSPRAVRCSLALVMILSLSEVPVAS
jgi:ATP-dependent exoDNAse (exonuclease V) beta subunit